MFLTSDTLHQLGTLATRRAELISAEARLWTALARLLLAAAEVPHATTPKVEALSSQDQVLSVKDAAAFLHLAPSSLNRWRVCGGGPEFIRVGRRILHRRTALDAFLAQHGFRNTSAYGR
jgi:hypothetical protein